jgi:hypothetical protein
MFREEWTYEVSMAIEREWHEEVGNLLWDSNLQ